MLWIGDYWTELTGRSHVLNITLYLNCYYVRMLAEDIAKLMSMIPIDEENKRQNDDDKIIVKNHHYISFHLNFLFISGWSF